MNKDTIVAQATAPGKGGVGIVRVSGKEALSIATHILGYSPTPRYAHYGDFLNTDKTPIDQGIALFFSGPNSFTGEDVLELQGHGGPIILDMLIERVMALGARMAKPGEFSERAFLNDKIDLAQAEAIADLIDANSVQAAKNALSSLQGEFSQEVNALVEHVIHLRMYVEAAIDFPEEEVDFLSDTKITNDLNSIITHLQTVYRSARQGAVIREGMKVVIAGRPNAGKSSLLNALAEKETAIVTEIEGTTRDVLREHIYIDGMPLHIIDTAGLRDSPDQVERIGIERAWKEIAEADQILLVLDSTQPLEKDIESLWPEFYDNADTAEKITVLVNKIDQQHPQFLSPDNALNISAKHGNGLDELRAHLKNLMGLDSCNESRFSARRRHLEALQAAEFYLLQGQTQLSQHQAGELLAEDLRQAQSHLDEITGTFSPDDLLGKIFSSFCIGK